MIENPNEAYNLAFYLLKHFCLGRGVKCLGAIVKFLGHEPKTLGVLGQNFRSLT
jgi:hypothetical protein